MPAIDLSLDRIRLLQAQLPPYTRPTCHIAGTNGKGSVSALLHSILRASGSSVPLTVGRFNSPHLVTIRDSIILNDAPVSPAAYNQARNHVENVDSSHGIGASNFELLTCTALYLFERARADVVVLEVGMGGRLDATNIVPDDCILASALTAVDLDHQAFLGTSISAIAREKASIARPGKPFVLGQQSHPEVEPVMREVVERIGGDVLIAPEVELRGWDESIDGPYPAATGEFVPPVPQPIEAHLSCFAEPLRALLPLHGAHQLANLSTALGVVSALLTHPSTSIAQGIRNTTWTGRLSFRKVTLAPPSGLSCLVLADGAHNPASAHTLAAYLSPHLARTPAPAITFLLALSHSPPKRPHETLAPLLGLSIPRLAVALLPFSPPEKMPWVHPEPFAELRATVNELAPQAEVYEPDARAMPQAQLSEALTWAAQRQQREGGLIVVAGSLYLVGDFYRLLEGIQAAG
ncbi:Mur ligase [Sparassis latifolia]